MEPRGADIAAESSGNAIRELADRLVEEAARASEFRVRLEIAETAQSTLRQELDEERNRREEAERVRDDLHRQLNALRDERESPETVEEATEGAEPRPATGRAQEGAQHQSSTLRDWSGDVEARRRPWWRRILGG